MARIVYGVHPVEEVVRKRAGAVQALMIARTGPLPPTISEALARGLPSQRATCEELDALCGSSSHQGVAALVGDFQYTPLDLLLARAEGGPPPLLVVLDSITDPQNLGAIMRSALVLGATGLVLPKDRSASVTPAVVRVSAGASEHLPCARVTNLVRALEQAKESGLWVAGTVEKGGVPPQRADLRGPVALVLGSEGKGMRPLVQRACDLVITIPSASRIASLNVAAAAAAILYEASRQRA